MRPFGSAADKSCHTTSHAEIPLPIRRGIRYALGMLYFLLATAFAGPPTVVSESADVLVGTVSLPVAPAEVLPRLGDPAWVTAVSGGGTTTAVREVQGPCLTADYVSPSAIMKVTYTVRQCKTTDGFEAKLVESNAFSTYNTRWTVKPSASGGTDLTYRMELRTSLMVPNSMVTSAAKKGMLGMLSNLAERFGAR